MAKTETPAQKRKHRATYAADKRSGGYLIRIVGPNADRFVGCQVPVTLKDNTEHDEKLTRLIWTGVDLDIETKEATGQKAALYRFEPRPRVEESQVEF